jgi:UDP-2-acetamido-2,6-beta-L-arabino-hexul-4-ose reductase
MKVLVTGANGFIGKNLIQKFHELSIQSVSFNRDMKSADLADAIKTVDFIFHLAAVNRPLEETEFEEVNKGLTSLLCELIKKSGRKIPIVFTSTIKVIEKNSYGLSKLAAENLLVALEDETATPICIFRLPNVFGKWSRPNYNSAVATFCYNIANDLPIQINDRNAIIQLVYVDDLIRIFIDILGKNFFGVLRPEISPIYSITIGELATKIQSFKSSRKTLLTEDVGRGIVRALYSTYLSFLKPEQFYYALSENLDDRGRFVEVLKTKNAGQFSFFSAHPGITRGGHYHHTKTEKFLVIQGLAQFKFRNILTGQASEITVSGNDPKVVESIPGWSHDLTNIGENELLVLLWANEIFDKQAPDTFIFKG